MDATYLLVIIGVVVVVVAFIVGLARWIFRIDDIVKRLDTLIMLLSRERR